MEKATTLKRLSRLKPELASCGVIRVGLFGSTVRGEQTKGSDIDILIDFRPEQETYQNFLTVCERLESAFKRSRLDIVTLKGISPYFGNRILSEVEYV